MSTRRVLSQHECALAASAVALTIAQRLRAGQVAKLWPVPRGGVPAAYLVANALTSMARHSRIVDRPEEADYFIDDLIDSGSTRRQLLEKHPHVPFYALFEKKANDDWMVFPWERDLDRDRSDHDIVLRMLQAIGEDATREGLTETPARVTKAWKTWFSGYGQDPKDVLKVFEDGAEGSDEMVLLTDIPVYSFCEHHMAPIFGVAHVAYIPNGKIVGLSKLARLVDVFARRLQVQERLTNQIADALMEHLDALGAGVMIQARHGCMESRGVCKHGVVTTTNALRGALKHEHDARAEFLSLVQLSSNRSNAIL